jgi:hypothetical protein
MDSLPTPNNDELPGGRARTTQDSASRKRKNSSAAKTVESFAPHNGSLSRCPVAKRQQRSDDEIRAADRIYQKTMRDKKAELSAMHAPIDTEYDLFEVMPKKSNTEMESLMEFKRSLYECVKQSGDTPPTRWWISHDGVVAIQKCRSVVEVQIELKKHMMCTATPELMFIPTTLPADGMGERLLSCMLNTNFNAIYQPATKTFKPAWSISDQLREMKGQDGDAHQPATTRSGQPSTKTIDYESVERAFSNANVQRDIDYGLNVLDIANNSGRTFTPDIVRDVDILRMIHDKQTRQKSYNRDSAMPKNQDRGHIVTLAPEWMILSMHGAVSPWHADSAGYCTFVVGIEGRKVWHLVKGDWSETKVEFGVYGTHHNRWNAGVFTVPLNPGCSL